MEHIRSDHPNYIDKIKKRANPIVSKLAKNRYGWLEWIVVNGFPFSFVENEVSRRYTNLEPISRRTLLKDMQNLNVRVEKDIAKKLPKN